MPAPIVARMDVPARQGSIDVTVGTNHGVLVVGEHNVVNLTGAGGPVLSPCEPAAVHRPLDPDGFLDRRVETAQRGAIAQCGAYLAWLPSGCTRRQGSHGSADRANKSQRS